MGWEPALLLYACMCVLASMLLFVAGRLGPQYVCVSERHGPAALVKCAARCAIQPVAPLSFQPKSVPK